MESAFGWIGQLFESLLDFIPSILLVRTTHEGVKFKTGNKIKIIKCNNGIPFPYIRLFMGFIPLLCFYRSGIHIYWPIFTECEIVPIKRQTTNLVEQYLCTKDGKTIGVSGILVYEVSDVEKLLTECYDYEDTIQDLALAAIKRVIMSHSLKYLQENHTDTDKELTVALRKELNRFGIKTIRVTLSDLSPCKMVGLWGSLVNISQTMDEE